jgi:hypothetical protein
LLGSDNRQKNANDRAQGVPKSPAISRREQLPSRKLCRPLLFAGQPLAQEIHGATIAQVLSLDAGESGQEQTAYRGKDR